MRGIFYVFTGTGNTKKVCEALIAACAQYGAEWKLYLIRKGEEVPSPEGYDAVAVGYPVHAFNAPSPVLKFLKKLPKRKGEKLPAFLVRTSGEPLRLNHASGILPARILRRRGFEVRGEFHYVMPYNIIFRHSNGMAARMWQTALMRIQKDAPMLAEGKGTRAKVGVFRRFVSFVLRIEHPAMPVVGLTYHAAKSCIGCGKCVKVCPQRNIAMKDGKPKFGGSCVACMACAFSCPVDAVRPSLLNGWRVNGAYDFDAPPAQDSEVCNYCKKAYLNYFNNAHNFLF